MADGPDQPEFAERRLAVGTARFSTYLEHAGASESLAWKLYEWNIRVSAALLTPLGLVEVILRNKIFDSMNAQFGGSWLDDEDLLDSSEQLKIKVAHRYLQRKGGLTSGPSLIAELPFGFWVGLLSNRYDQSIWRTCLHTAFLPGARRKELHVILDRSRTLRNRIAHHEHLLHRDLPTDLDGLATVLHALSPRVADWALGLVDAGAVIAQRPVPFGS